MKTFKKSEYELFLQYGKNYIGIVKNQSYRPQLGDRLELDEDDVGKYWYEIVGFPNNLFPITRSRSWVVEVKKSTPYTRIHESIEIAVYK